MVSIRDIPLVVPLANYVWGGNDEEEEAVGGGAKDEQDTTSSPFLLSYSPDLCLDTLPFMTTACWKQGIIKGLGIAIILGSFLNKAPIMINIWQSKSAQGLAKTSLYMDVLLYCNWFFYGLLQNFPITAYGENGALLGQSLIIVVMMWYFDDKTNSNNNTSTSLQERMGIGFVFCFYVMAILFVLPPTYQSILISSSLPITIYGRGSQILETHRLKHCGAQSIITLSTTLIGIVIRIVTTLSELKGEVHVMMGMITGLCINGTLVVQYFLYKSNTEKFLKELKEGKEEETKTTKQKKKE